MKNKSAPVAHPHILKTLLIGARGVGKSRLLRRWQHAMKGAADGVDFVDLDDLVEKNQGQTAGEILARQGERFFRKAEETVLEKLLTQPQPMVIAVGAGFKWESWKWPIPRQIVEVIWVHRKSDLDGRIFVDRPRLDPDKAPLVEFRDRHAERFPIFEKLADWIYEMPEGLFEVSNEELILLDRQPMSLQAIFTLHPRHWRWLDRDYSPLQTWNFSSVELRDDLWDDAELKTWQEILRKLQRRILWAARAGTFASQFSELIQPGDDFDWALELGAPTDSRITIISSHGEKAPDEQGSFFGKHLKWSPPVENFAGIVKGWQWQQLDPRNRSFLPRSHSGRWQWFRQLMKGLQKLNFVRECQVVPSQPNASLAPDQPSLHDWMRSLPAAQTFAAVLGDPVNLSWSPLKHYEFFRLRSMPFVAVEVKAEEFVTAMKFLTALGLRAAAITSPLKQMANEWSAKRSPACEKLNSANTLTWLGDWHAENTDIVGLDRAIGTRSFPPPVAVWGGGGTLNTVLQMFPAAATYSVRTGLIRDASELSVDTTGSEPQTLVWAASPSGNFPKRPWRPAVILDLNYKESSNARALAQQTGAEYISGQEMFNFQALAQQQIWSRAFPLGQ